MSRKIAMGAVLSLALLSACSTFADKTPGALDGYTAEEIFQRGEYELNRNQPDDAAYYFGEIERLYPYSDLGQARPDHAGLLPIIVTAITRIRAPAPSAMSISTPPMTTRPMRNTCWRCPITTRSTRSGAIRA